MKRLYNRIAGIYSYLSGGLSEILGEVIEQKIAKIPDISSCTALEYACGTGNLSLQLSPLFKTVTSHDLSVKMLDIARKRAGTSYSNLTFSEGDILNISKPDKSYDYAFVSFALHLFPYETEVSIIRNLCSVARKGVFIIDHAQKWNFAEAIIEWLEGGYYDQFIKFDFEKVAAEVNCKSFNKVEFERCTLFMFTP